jgi:hypothetical protein
LASVCQGKEQPTKAPEAVAGHGGHSNDVYRWLQNLVSHGENSDCGTSMGGWTGTKFPPATRCSALGVMAATVSRDTDNFFIVLLIVPAPSAQGVPTNAVPGSQ